MKLWPFLVIAALAAVVALSGCVGTFSIKATPTPVPTPAPTPLPTAEQTTIGTEHGTQVRLSNITVALATCDNPSLQAENFTLTFENTGDAPANNVAFNFRESDLRKGWELFSEVYLVGTIPANGNVFYQFTTPSHREAYSVIADVEIYWGEKVEYNSTVRKTFTLVGLPTPSA